MIYVVKGFRAMYTISAEQSFKLDGVRAVLSLREAVLLAEVSESRVRKDIEKGVLSPLRTSTTRPCFRWPDVFFLNAVYRNALLTGQGRGRVFQHLVETLLQPTYRHQYTSVVCTHPDNDHAMRIWDFPSHLVTRCSQMKIDDTLFIDFDRVLGDLGARVDSYARGLSRIEERPDVLGGEPVFKGSRLPVRHVAKLSVGGESTADILLDYPYLMDQDITFARLYHEAHPMKGRPRSDAETHDAVDDH
jgi:uncharacterized protein (DUF433 family)